MRIGHQLLFSGVPHSNTSGYMYTRDSSAAKVTTGARNTAVGCLQYDTFVRH